MTHVAGHLLGELFRHLLTWYAGETIALYVAVAVLVVFAVRWAIGRRPGRPAGGPAADQGQDEGPFPYRKLSDRW